MSSQLAGLMTQVLNSFWRGVDDKSSFAFKGIVKDPLVFFKFFLLCGLRYASSEGQLLSHGDVLLLPSKLVTVLNKVVHKILGKSSLAICTVLPDSEARIGLPQIQMLENLFSRNMGLLNLFSLVLVLFLSQ